MRDDFVVTKANALVEASYRLSVSEQRIIALLASQIHPNDKDFKSYRFKVSDLETLIAERSRTQKGLYGQIKALTRGLIGKVLQIQESNSLLQVAWLSKARYRAGEVELGFAPELKPYLLQLKERFTSYKLLNVIKLRSRYSVRLYELCKQYEQYGQRSFELPELRKTLGIGDEEYPKWKDFRVNVLDLAKRELPQKTDIAFNYATRKQGRAVHWVDLKIWSTCAKAVPTKEILSLKKEAQKCFARCSGHCGSTWNNYKDKPKENCHWCTKHEKRRLEAEGQQRLPGMATETPELEPQSPERPLS